MKLVGYKKVISLALMLLLMSINAFAQADDNRLSSELSKCGLIANSSDRLACFDLLVENTSDLDDATPTLPKTLGGGRFGQSAERKKGNRGLVTRCQKAQDDKMFFIFENGQVWKQVKPSVHNRKLKDCNFYVTIKRDNFGYKLKIDNETWSSRVQRHK